MSDEYECVVPGCDRKRKARGLCPMHYQRPSTRQEYGLPPRVFLTSLEERLRQYVVDPQTGCWIWAAGRRGNGYGEVQTESGSSPASRASYEFHIAPVPAGMEVCHRCDTPLCIRPDHLFLGTHSENMADMAAKGRASRWGASDTCTRGHAFDEENTLYPPSGGRQCRACNHLRHVRRRSAQGLPIGRPIKTHCPQGHEYSEENTYVTPEGWRHCRACGRAATMRYSRGGGPD